MDYLDDLQQTQTISKETAQALRDYIDGKVSTGKIAAHIVARLRVELAPKEAHFDNKITELSIKVKEQDGFIQKIKRAFGGVVK